MIFAVAYGAGALLSALIGLFLLALDRPAPAMIEFALAAACAFASAYHLTAWRDRR